MENLKDHAGRRVQLVRYRAKGRKRSIATLYVSVNFQVRRIADARGVSVFRYLCLIGVVGSNVGGDGHRPLPLRTYFVRAIHVTRLCLDGYKAMGTIHAWEFVGR